MRNVAPNPWKWTAIGLSLSIVVALVTGLVVAHWTGSPREAEDRAVTPAPAPPSRAPSAPRAAAPPSARPAPAPKAPAPTAAKVPGPSAIQSCNQYAEAHAGPHDKTMEVIKDGLIGAAAGAAVGAAGGAIADGGKGAGKGAAIGGLVGAGGGTLYGLNENRRYDERYREAYAGCMRARGYLG
jgi:hypothetical protein